LLTTAAFAVAPVLELAVVLEVVLVPLVVVELPEEEETDVTILVYYLVSVKSSGRLKT